MKRLLWLSSLVLLPLAASAQGAWTQGSLVPGSRGAASGNVAISANGTIAVAWTGARVAVRLPGGRWQRVRMIATPHTTAEAPDVAFDARGHLLVAWTQSPARAGQPFIPPYTVRVREWTRKGGWGAVRVLGRSRDLQLAEARIATNQRGDAIVFWRGLRPGHPGVSALASSERVAGGRFGRARVAPGGGPYRDVALDTAGNAYGVYTSATSPRNFFVYQRRGHGWGKQESLPGSPATKPRIGVAGDRLAAIVWRAAGVDSEATGIQSGPPWAILRTPGGGYTLPVQLSTIPVTDVDVASPCLLMTWAAANGLEPQTPGLFDLHWGRRGEGYSVGGDTVVPGARMGPSGCMNGLYGGGEIVVYAIDNAVRSIWRTGSMIPAWNMETVADSGLNPSLGTSDRAAAATWLDPAVKRLRVARFTATRPG
jgi:hypothetical protein